jgi:predicted phage terminase large subunit-like protein
MREYGAEERHTAGLLARKDLYFFSRWTFQQRKRYQWQRAPHHRLICDALMRVFRGECRRLIINIPPRYSKTELAVVNFIAWAMGQVPDSEFIHVSYSGELAQSNSSNVLQVMRHEAYREIFPAVELASDAKHHWRTTSGGVLYTAGVGGTLTGFGAGKEREGFGGAIIIDDPHKADEARSDTIRKNVLEWFQNTLESRKNSPARTPVILIMQRLHAEDLAGWLLDGGNGEQWEHLCLPALQEDGTALWPEKHKVEDLRRMETAAPYTFAGQYQQRPSPGEGGVFKPGAIQIIDAVPAGAIRWCRGWDLGSTVDGDYTAGPKLGKLPDGRYVIADVQRERLGPDERDALIVNTAAADGKSVRVGIPQDPGQAGRTQVLYLTRQLAGYTVKTSPESGDKVTRAEPFAAQVNVGNVLMVRGKWNKALTDEMRDFPNGKYDDQIDGASRAFSELLAPSQAMDINLGTATNG